MGLEQISGGGQGSVLESLKLSTKKKADDAPPAESDAVAKYTRISPDVVVNTKVNRGTVPATKTVDQDVIPSEHTPLIVGNKVYTNIRKVTDGMDLEDAKKITAKNKIDEVFFKTEDGKLYVAYGTKEDKGALDLDGVQESYVGKFGKQTAKIVYINNETNTVKEGALDPLKSTWQNVKEAGATGVAKGISEMGGTVIAMFVGKSLIQNGVTAVQEADKVAETATKGAKLIKNGAEIVKDTGKAGKVIVTTVGSGLKQVGVGVAIAGVVVGTIAGGMSIYGAISAKKPKNDFNTIDMVTDPYLAYVPANVEKK